MITPKNKKKHHAPLNIVLSASIIASSVILASCGDNVSVLDIREEFIKEQQIEQDVQQKQEQLQQRYLDTTQSISERTSEAVKTGAAEFSETTRTYAGAAQTYANEKTAQAADIAQDTVDRAKQTSEELTEETKQNAEGAVDKATDLAEDAATDTKDALSDLAGGIGDELTDLKKILLTPTSEFGDPESANAPNDKLNASDNHNISTKNASDPYDGSTSDKALLDKNTCNALLSSVPQYSGNAYVVVNNNMPFFNANEYPPEDFEKYSSYDELGRCQAAIMCTSRAMLNGTERESIGMYKPSGWAQKKYDSIKNEGNPAGYI